MVEKARQKLVEAQAAEKSQHIDTEVHAEADCGIDKTQQQDTMDTETHENQAQEEEGSVTQMASKTIDEVAETVDLDDSIVSIDSDLECSTSNVSDANTSTSKDKEKQGGEEEEEEETHDEPTKETEPSADKSNETPERNNDAELMECDASPPQQPESQAEQIENCEPEVAHDENSVEQTDFTENEAQSIDDNSNDGGGLPEKVPEQCHDEITSTNEDENNETTDDVGMQDDDTMDKNDACDASNNADDNELTNEENDIDAIVNDVANEVIASEEMVMADDCVALEETVATGNGESAGDGGGGGSVESDANDQPANETESIFSDLSDCNQLVNDVNEDISNVISTSASLDVASLLESGDFENISSPEAFN